MASSKSRDPLDDGTGNIMGVPQQKLAVSEDTENAPKASRKPPATKSSPFASTLQKDHADLSEKSIRDLNSHKVSRNLAEEVFTRWKIDSSITNGFNIDNIPSHPDLAESVSTCSESSIYDPGHSNNALDSEAGSIQAESETLEESDSPKQRRPQLQLEIPGFAKGPPIRHGSTTEIGGDISAEKIEEMLDTLLTRHRDEYDRDVEKMRAEELSQGRSTSGKGDRPQPILNTFGKASPQVTEEIVRHDFPGPGRYARSSARNRERNRDFNARSFPNSPPELSGHRDDRDPSWANRWDNKGYISIPPSIADRLLKITEALEADGILEVGRARNRGTPPRRTPAVVLGRNTTFRTQPSGYSFACIFTVKIPKGNYSAPLSKHGRPLIPDGIPIEKLTVVATYHPSYRHVVMDILDYAFPCPVGFDSGQLVDLIHLQNCGFIPPYSIRPDQPFSFDRYQVATEWSLCVATASGFDVLYVSDVDVMVQRIAGSMFRAHETKGMSASGLHRYLESISEDCAEVVEVELFSKVTGLVKEPMFTTVHMDYHKSAELDWMPLNADPQQQLPHSRNSMPVREF